MKTERRAVARYRAKIPVRIEIDDYRFDATTTEISLQGLRILCSGPVANSVFNQYIQVTPGENITANININISNAVDLADTLNCQTRVITVNRVSQDSYIVGFKIIEFFDDGFDRWHEHIATKH